MTVLGYARPRLLNLLAPYNITTVYLDEDDSHSSLDILDVCELQLMTLHSVCTSYDAPGPLHMEHVIPRQRSRSALSEGICEHPTPDLNSYAGCVFQGQVESQVN